jgi:hypothetical protein
LGLIFGYLLTGIHPGKLAGRKYKDLASAFIYPASTSEEQKKILNDQIIVLLDRCLADKPSLRPSAEAVRIELTQMEKMLPPPMNGNRWVVPSFLSLLVVLLIFFYGPSILAGFGNITPTPTSISVVPPTTTPTPTASVVPPTTMPTPTASVIPPTTTSTPKPPTVTPVILPPTVTPNITIQILTDIQDVVKCNNDIETISLGNIPKKFAFTVQGNLRDDYIYELQIVPDGSPITIDSSIIGEGEKNPNFYFNETYYYFEVTIDQSFIDARNLKRSTPYEWLVVVKSESQIFIKKSRTCKFTFG